MAARYWVGGSGTWDATTTTNWSATDGGAGGASAPTSADNVIFNLNSAAAGYTVTMTAAAVCADWTVTSNATVVPTFAGAAGTCYGSFSMPATNRVWTATGTLTFAATATGKTITSGGLSYTCGFTFNRVGGGWTQSDNLTLGSTTLTLTAGSYSTGNFSITASTINASSATTSSLSLGSSTITLSNSLKLSGSGLTLNSGTSNITMNGTFGSLAVTGRTLYNVSYTGNPLTFSSFAIAGAIFNNLTISGTTSATSTVYFGPMDGDITVNGTFTATGSNGYNRYLILSNSATTQRTITANAVSLTDVDFQGIVGAGAASWTGTRLGNVTNNSGITFPSPKTVYWNLAAGGAYSGATGWAATSGGSPDNANYPLPQDTAVIENTGLNTSASISIGSQPISTLDLSSRTNAMTLALSSTPFIGNLSLGSGVTITGTAHFAPVGTHTVTSNGKSFAAVIVGAPTNNPLRYNSGISTLGDDLTATTSFEVSNPLLGGSTMSLDLNGKTLVTPTFFANTNSVLAFNAGNIQLNGTGTVWTDSGSYTFTGTSDVRLTNASATARTISASNATETNSINFKVTAGTSALTTTGFIRNLDFTGSSGSWANSTCTIYGNLTISTGMTVTAGNGVRTLGATSGTQVITTNGKTMDFPLTLNGVGGTFQLADNYTGGSTRTITLTNGAFDLNGKTLITGLMSITGATTRSIAFNAGNIQLNGTGTVWTATTLTNFSLTGTSDVRLTNSSATARTITAGAPTEAQAINFDVTAGTGTLTLTAGSMKSLDLTGYAGTLGNTAMTFYGNLTISTGSTLTAGTNAWTFANTSGTAVITTNGKTFDNPITFNGVGGTFQFADTFTAGATRTMTLTNGTLDLNGKTVTTGLFSSSNSNARVIQFNAGNLTLNGVGTVFTTSTITNFSYTGTSDIRLTNATASARTITPGAATEAQAQNFKVSAGSSTFTITAGNIKSIDFTGASVTIASTAVTIYGSFILGGSAVTAGTGTLTIANTSGTAILNSSGSTIDRPLTINANGGTVQLAGDWTVGATRAFIHNAGALDLNGFNLTGMASVSFTGANLKTLQGSGTSYLGGSVAWTSTATGGIVRLLSDLNSASQNPAITWTNGTLDLNGFTLAAASMSTSNANARTIAFGSGGILNLTATGTVWTSSTLTNFSTTGTGTVVCTDTGSSARTITPGAATEAQSINFSVNGGIGSVTITAGSVDSLDFTGFAGTLANTAVTIYGSVTLNSSMVLTAGANAWTFAATSGVQQIECSGLTLDFPITINAPGATVQLPSILYIGNTRTFTLTAGILDLNEFSLWTSKFVSSNSNNRTLDFGATGYIFAQVAGTIWNTATATNMTVLGTSNVIADVGSSSAVTITPGSPTEANAVTFKTQASTTGTVTITAGSVRTLYIDSACTLANTALTVYGDIMLSASVTINAGANAWTLASALVSQSLLVFASYVDFPVTIAGSGTGSVDLATSFGTLSGKAFNFNSGTLNLNNAQIAGPTEGCSLLSITGAGTRVLKAGGTSGYVSGGIVMNGVGGSLTLGDDFTDATSALTLTNGTLDLGGFNHSFVSLASNNSNTRTLALNSGTLELTGSGTVVDCATSTGMTVTDAGSTISLTSGSAKTFAGGGKTYGTLNQGGSGALSVTGANTFDDITATVVPNTLTLPSGVTTTVLAFSIATAGTLGNLVTLDSSTPGSAATLSMTSGTVNADYMSIKDSAATGGATWNAPLGNGNINVSGNSGWIFGAVIYNKGGFFSFF